MKNEFILTKTILIRAPKSKVWDALTNPKIIEKYFFGTKAECDWKKGSRIFFRGEWEGKPYEDKGTILEIDHGNFVKYNYWSSFSGTPDVPENYAIISYTVKDDNDGTSLTITQDGHKSVEARDHSDKNWGMVLEGLKKVVES